MRKLLSILLLLVPQLACAHNLAIVNGQAITDQEVYALNPAAQNNLQVRNQLLQELIDRTLIIQAANKEGLDQTPGFQKKLAQQREQLLLNAAADQWIKKHPVSLAEMKSRYEQIIHSEPKEQWRLREILVRESKDAYKILKQLRSGGNFSDLAAQQSVGVNAELGGELGWVNVNQLPASEADLVVKLKVGQVVGPIVVPQGFLIVQLLGQRPVVPLPFDAVKQQIINQLHNKALNQYVAGLRKQSKVEVFTGGDEDVK